MTHDMRTIGQTRDAGFQIGARRTLPIPLAEAWRLLMSREGLQIWLSDSLDMDLAKGAVYRLADGTSGMVSVYEPNSHLRMTWHPPAWPRPSIIQLRVIPNGERTTISFHQEHLPGPNEREERRAHYTAALDNLERIITNAS
jgi:uncharacterized protein YndB with AHSA1/START domain